MSIKNDESIKPLSIKNDESIKPLSIKNDESIKPLNIKNDESIKPLSIKNDELTKTLNIKNDELTKTLNIKNSIIKNTIISDNEKNKKFDLTFNYLKSKVNNINGVVYQEIKDIIKNIDRENKENHDNEILEYGKLMQEKITNNIIEISEKNGSLLLTKINDSHKIIVKNIQSMDNENKKSFSDKIKKLFIVDNTPLKTKENIIIDLKKEINRNKKFLKEIKSLENDLKNYKMKLKIIEENLEIYIEVGKVLKEEFEIEGFLSNNDLINKRIISLSNTSNMLKTTFGIIELHEIKSINYNETINNVINILIPNFINILSINEFKYDEVYIELKNSIIQQLNISI